MIAELKTKVKLWLFRANGMKPWSKYYYAYRWTQIEKNIQPGAFNLSAMRPGYGYRTDDRVVEYAWLCSRLPPGPGKMLDAGSSLNFDPILKHPSLQSKKLFISTLAPETQAFWDRGVSYVYEDLRSSCFRDNYFDWVASISTVEHIGMDNTFLYTNDESKNESRPESYFQAIREYYRILKPGGTLYLSVPFGRTGDYGWFQVFTGEMIDEIIDLFDRDSAIEVYFKYEANGWRKANRDECRDAEHFDIHKQKTLNEICLAASGAIVCLELIKPK